MEFIDTLPRNNVISEFIVSFIFTLIQIPIMIWYYRRIKYFPIYGMDPYLLLVVAFGGWIGRIGDSLGYLKGMPCAFTQALRVLSVTSAVFVYALRGYTLLHRFKVTALLVEVNRRKYDRETLVLENWYVRNRWIIRPWALTLFSVINFMITLMYIFIDLRQGGDFCPAHFTERKISNILKLHMGLLTIFALILAYKLYHVKGDDAFGVKKELKLGLINALIWQLSGIIYGAIVGAETLVLNGYDFWYRLFAILPLFFLSTLYPLYRSYTFLQHDIHINISLEQVLGDKNGIDSFLAFLKKEFSTENLLFYQQVMLWLESAQNHPVLNPPTDVAPPSLSPNSISTKSFFPPNSTHTLNRSATVAAPGTPKANNSNNTPDRTPTNRENPTPTNQRAASFTPSGLLPSTSMDQLLSPPSPRAGTTGVSDLSPTHATSVTTPVGGGASRGGPDSHIQLDIELSQQAYYMLENYLNTGAKFCLNLSDRTRTMVVAAIDGYGNSGQSTTSLKELIVAFEKTKKEIYNLMDSDSFRRYLQSSEFESFRKEYIKSSLAQQTSPSNLHHLSLIYEEEKKSKASSKGKSNEAGSIGGSGAMSRTQPLGASEEERDGKSSYATSIKEEIQIVSSSLLNDESRSGLRSPSGGGLELGFLSEEGEGGKGGGDGGIKGEKQPVTVTEEDEEENELLVSTPRKENN